SNLTVAGTSLSTNTVVLNYTGTAHPLRVFNSITVNPNGILLNLSGAISLEGDTNQLMIGGGVVNQDGGSNFFGGTCYVGYTTNYGSYNLTNGTLLMGNVSVDSGGVFNQINGTTTVDGGFGSQQSYYSVGSGAKCTVAHGALTANSMLISGYGSFYQGDAAIIVANVLTVGELLSRFTASTGFYYLTNGTLTTAQTQIGQASDGYFYQYGGTHRTGFLDLFGESRYGWGIYELDGGNLMCTNAETIQVNASLTQNGGTNNVGGNLTLYDAFYNLNGGVLGTSNVLVQGDGAFGQGFQPVFVQSNGTHYITNTLTVSAFATYNLYGGSLAAAAIELGSSGNYPPGVLNHSGGTLSSGATIFSGGTLTGSGTEMLGTLTLRGSNSVDSLSSNCVQHFAASAQIPWERDAVLQINKGLSVFNHIYVGQSANALTARQLQQIRFGTFGYGKLLQTGELVSWPVPPLAFEAAGVNFALSWPGTAVLQWADDPAGPYTDVPGASSPFTPSINAPRKFFRLRQG
ncbi:MAG: hypothetical protein ACXWKH_18660, partial [Limisphaerales bacterium]